MKFEKTKYDSLDGSTKVRFTQGEHFYIEASRMGVQFKGELLIESFEQLDAFAKTLSEAYTQHRKLTPKITASASGH